MLPKKRNTKRAKRNPVTKRIKRRASAKRTTQAPPPSSAPVDREYVNAAEAAALTGIPVKSLEAMRSKRIGPSFIKFGVSIRYAVAELRAWMETHRVSTERGAK